MPLPAKHLLQTKSTPVTVSPENSLTEALSLMLKNDFSQLPVLDEDGRPTGIVTTDSIARALLNLGTKVRDLHVIDAVIKAPTFPVDEDLLYLLDFLLKSSAVLIVDGGRKLIGIITDYDTTQYFRGRAEDIVLVEDIESTLKAHIRNTYSSIEEESTALQEAVASLGNSWDGMRKKSVASLKHLCKSENITPTQETIDSIVDKHFPSDKEKRRFDDLTLAEYIQLAMQEKAWKKLRTVFRVPREAWHEMMESVRETRNKLVHFRGDISSIERDQLRYCADWYKSHQPLPNSSHQDLTSDDNQQNNNTFEDTNNDFHLEKEQDETIDNKYAPLVEYLLASDKHPVRNLTFIGVEKIIKNPLPKAAREHTTWWMGSSDIQSPLQQLLPENWRVLWVNLSKEKVILAKKKIHKPNNLKFSSN
ncbi:CBS domain-containing protein [Hymenobacter edaphi]|uniref:CBS domain-containing protein n=1 Tax=Hymenobacter edaphi TaxID=2211146 RepID=A0A328BBI6_9BACT|nr:CBS domain-containing protein [Hymenobacter edaphi]RAK63821.1 hypothetical protein DLM85_19925 [Hymenobacter edaphi]